MTLPKRKNGPPTPAPPAPAPVPEEAPPPVELLTDKLGPTEVAILIGKRYQYTRDLMLKGEFGRPEFNKRSPKGTLTVTRAQVLAYIKRKMIPAGPPPDPPSAP